ncbi:MAG TPA: hypothetical protein VFW71_11565 [Actinomycetota bacterium]|nr:hypothetical protein [Actinomycetota bacterium]
MGQLVVLGLVAGSIPVLLQSASALPSNFVAIDGSILKTSVTSTYDWGNSGPTRTVSASNVVSVAGTGGIFDGGKYQGPTTPPVAPPLTPQAAADPTIAHATFVPVPLQTDTTACGTGQPQVFSSGLKSGSAINALTWGLSKTTSKDQISDIYSLSHVTGTGSAARNEIFFGAERTNPNGDTHIDFEFLQSSVTTNADANGCAPSTGGTFAGHRTEGDLLASVDISGNGTPTFGLYRWQCASTPGPIGVVCDPTSNSGFPQYVLTSNQAVTLATNNATIPCGGWACRDDSGALISTLVPDLFMEGGIDLNAAGFGTGCFNTFLPHTRTSGSISSNLGEFAGPIVFSNCETPNVSTSLRSGAQSGQSISVPAGSAVSDTATLTNTTSNPSGTLTYQVFTDPNCTVASTSPAVSQTVLVAANGVVQPSSNVTFPTGGTYYWQATYNGSTAGRDLPAKSPCNEILTVQSAGIAIQKTADASPVSAGSQVGFTIGVTSTGTGQVNGVNVTDTLPTTPGTVWTATPTVGTCSTTGGVLTCAIGSLNAGQSASIHLTSPSTPASCGTIPNTASVTTTNDGGGTSSASVVVNCPTLTINKVPVTPTVTAGGPVAFNIGVTNTTTGTATGVTITDPLPNTGVAWTFSPASQPCTISGPINAQVLNCTVGNLNQNQGFNVQVSSPSSLSTAGSIPNTATATATNAPSVSSTASVAVNHPNISITKTADKAMVDAGGQVGFTIMVQNAGPGDANGVTITDTIPALTGTSWSVDSGNTTAVGCTITGNVLTCLNQTIPAPPTNNGQIAVHVVATTNQNDCGTIQNVASFQANNDGTGTSTPAATITINCANVNFVKNADQSPVTAGDPIGFTITATNTGAGAANNVSVTDTLPSAPGVSWTVASVSPAGVSCVNNAGTLDCTLASLAGGATMVIHLTSPTTAASAGACTNGTATINNNATLMIGNAMGGQSGDSITLLCANLGVTKTAATSQISAGDAAVFTVTVTSSGPGTAEGVTLTDTLPASVANWTITSQPTGNPCAIAGGVLTCTYGTMAPNTTNVVTISGTTSQANCEVAISNQANVAGTNLPASDTTTTASASITVACPALSVTKTPDATPISAGDPIGFTVAVTNTAATAVAHGFAVSDPLPSGTATLTWSIASQSNPGLCSISGAAGSQVLSCGGPTTNLAGGQAITVHITAQTSGATTSPVVNQVTATATNAPTQTATGTVVINHASITTSKTPDAATVSLGDPIGFTIAVTNTASGASGPITVTDTLPSAPGISWTVAPPTTAGVTCVNNAGTLVCTVPSLGLNGTAVIHLTSPTTAATGGACTTGAFSITNSALITSQNDGGGNPSGSLTVNCPSLSIQKTAASTSISAGDVASYSVTVTNAGPGTARGVTLTDTLPAGVSWTITSQPAGTPCAITGAGVLNCSFGDLAAGASASVSVSGTTSIANCAAALNNSASTGATNLPSSDTTTGASASIMVNCPMLGITKTAVASPISAGDPIGFTVVIANTSSAGTARGVVVSDPLPSSNGTLTWSITSQSPAGACSIGGTAGAQTLNCGPTNLGPGQSITVQIGATTASGTGGTVSNTATAMSSNNPTVSSTATVTVNHPNTVITKTADRSSVSSGDTIGYTITVDNSSGTGPANGVTITDTLPAGFTWQVDAVSTTATGCGISGGVLTCANNTIPAGGSIHVHISASTAGVACATIQNSARATVQNGSTITTQAPAQITINCPNLQFTKTADHASANEGDTIGYVIQVTNTSTAGNAYGVTVTDTLPAVTGTSWSLDAAGTSPGANCVLTGTTLTCTIGTLAPGATIRIHVTATTTPTTCGSVNNSANLTATNAPPQHTAVTTIVVGCPNLIVGKSASAATALPGGVVSFTIGSPTRAMLPARRRSATPMPRRRSPARCRPTAPTSR